MAVHCETVLQAIRDLCPPRFAIEGDVTGLQVGTAARQVERVLCTLDLTLEVAREACARGAGLVVSHHAVVFRPLVDLRTDHFKGRILETLIKGDVTVYVPHTAMDVVEGGINDHLARTCGLEEVTLLEETGREELVLLIGHRTGDDDALKKALYHEGAREVEFAGELVEAVARRATSHRVARRMSWLQGGPPRIVPLASGALPRGIGRVGRLPAPEPLRAFAARLREAVGAPGVRVVAARGPDHPVEKVAVLGGDGRRFVAAALFQGADVLVTGDVDHHTALEARARGLSLVDLGHWGSERQVVDLLVAGLRERLEGQPVEVVASEVSTQPFLFV